MSDSSFNVSDKVRIKTHGFIDADGSDIYEVTKVGGVFFGTYELTLRNTNTGVETTAKSTEVIKA